jgi:hypothetical protein
MRLKSLCVIVAMSVVPINAHAQLTIDMASITCGQYMAMPPDQSRNFAAWMSGWFSYQNRRTFVDFTLHQKNTANVLAWCQYHPGASVMSAVQSALGSQ